MATVFISYAQVDREHAKRLAGFLEGSGYSVWWDAGLRPGDVFTIEIQRQINQAQHLIVIWSRVSVASFWVTAEVTYARSCGKPILPLRIDDCIPPVPFNLLQTKDLKSIDVSGPEVAEALVEAGTLPRLPGASDEDDMSPGHAAVGVVRKAQELARWEFIKHSRSIGDFRTFLQRFPDGDLADLAQMRLEALRWEQVVAAGPTIADLEAFVLEFPAGVKAPEAKRQLERLHLAREEADWLRLRQGIFGWRKPAERRLACYEEFIRLHPTGVHAAQARAAMEPLRREVELWRAAADGNDRLAVERYLADFPCGSYASEAKAHRARLRRQVRHALPAMDGAGRERAFPLATFLSLAVAAFLIGCIGAYVGHEQQVLVALPVRVFGETKYFIHPYPILIGVFIAFLIHEWGNRSWVTTAFALAAVLAFRSAAQLLNLSEQDSAGYPVNSMVIGAMYCFGAWAAGFIVAPYMRRSVAIFLVSIVLGALAYPDWMLVLGLDIHGHEVLTAGVFFVACTMPIAYSLLRAVPAAVPAPAPIAQNG